MTAAESVRAGTLDKRLVNRLMREGLEKLDPTQPIAFFCECPDDRCLRPVWLNGRQYDRRRADPRWAALVPGHHAGEAAA